MRQRKPNTSLFNALEHARVRFTEPGQVCLDGFALVADWRTPISLEHACGLRAQSPQSLHT